MKKRMVSLSFLILLIGLFGCQQTSNDESQNTSGSTHDEETTEEDYHIAGVITEVDIKTKRVLLDLKQETEEDDEQMWVTIEEGTKVMNENKEPLSFEDLQPNIELKANIKDSCLEQLPVICFAEEVVIVG
ncbi:hypothetical protein N780_08745 [Pontibacillus chungwhensis BH030062]|uniref:DUF3221 domain-containing protein n=1 Tax=Pontibacillus chungwhensis BH030062 TaxID=1385513 RepID=A0A0A2USS0_9BACI|nr:hypothetical protein [Pontibacillus chungwhensis]KGP91332.1 hypothetical protein N780_08745 [Pontibacillus chungwhensis BH030062]